MHPPSILKSRGWVMDVHLSMENDAWEHPLIMDTNLVTCQKKFKLQKFFKNLSFLIHKSSIMHPRKSMFCNVK